MGNKQGELYHMPRRQSSLSSVRILFQENKILNLDDLKRDLGTSSTMTVYRYLKALSYLTSYSHRGSFYTLPDIPQFDELGLWSFQEVYFSRYHTLTRTVRHFVDSSQMGYSAFDLQSLVHVEVKHVLVDLVRSKQVDREKVAGAYVYYNMEPGVRRAQSMYRREWQRLAQLRATDSGVTVDELKAAVILFFSLLDEKQRRLYAGLEAVRMGHGGDRRVAELLGVDVHTVARGRRELMGGEVDRGRVRRGGGGRKSIEKKSSESWTESDS